VALTLLLKLRSGHQAIFHQCDPGGGRIFVRDNHLYSTIASAEIKIQETVVPYDLVAKKRLSGNKRESGLTSATDGMTDEVEIYSTTGGKPAMGKTGVHLRYHKAARVQQTVKGTERRAERVERK
jgi:hypothetical protein